MNTFNIYGLIIIVILLIPNAIYAIKHKEGFENRWKNKSVEILEQIGRFGCFGLMIFNVPGTCWGWWLNEALAIYLVVNTVLVLAYLLFWAICFNKMNRIFSALALSITPSLIFIFSGVMMRSLLLLIAAAIFVPCHIMISYKNANLSKKKVSMNITVINGTEKHGVTYRLKELFLAEFKDKATITEYYLPKDGPNFCSGCTNCILKGEELCKDAERVAKIDQSLLEADLIVLTSPAYVYHVTGAMKALLDHLAYRWMPHRPAPQMFGKRAVIITQCLGLGAKSAAKDLRHSLEWWGVSKIGVFTGALMGDIVWNKLPEKKQTELTQKVQKLSRKFAKIDYSKPAHTNFKTKLKFFCCRMLQKSLHQTNPQYLDGKYWADQGWLGKIRPWGK